MLDLRHLRSLVAIADTGKLATAAERVHLTQSALSHQIRALEEHHGLPLFERTRQGLSFLPAGERLLQLARTVLAEVQAAERDLQRLNGQATGELRIALECHTCFDWLMPVMHQFRQRWPGVEVDLVAGFHADPLTLLKEGRADLVIGSRPKAVRPWQVLPLFRFEILAVLANDHPWVKQAQAARKDILEKLATDRSAKHAADYRQTLAKLKRDYLTAYIAQHSKARLGVAEDKTKAALRKDPRLVAMRALAGISLMPTSQLTAFDDKLDKLKSCASLVESELAASPYCPHCSFRPANEQGDFLPAANVLKQLDEELDRLLDGWQQTLLDNLDDPIIQANLDLLKASARELIKKFVASKKLADPVTPDFVSAVQEALSGLEKIGVSGDDIKKALLQGGSPATPDDLRKRFETFLNERCKGKDASKLRFVVE